MGEAGKGIGALVATCLIWGLSPLYYKLLAHVPPLEVLSHRTLWSLLLFGGILLAQGRLTQLGDLLRPGRGLFLLVVASLMISTNWFLYILSIQIGRTVEASLGYYIFPLVAVVLGRVVFGERLSRGKWFAVMLALIAVLVLTAGLGVAPYISLVLATTFGLYGVIKKGVRQGPVVSVTGEVLLLAPLAAIWLAGVHLAGWEGLVGRNLATFGHDLRDSLLLAFSGPMTAVPLILFSYASRRLNLSTIGVLQYLNPSLQFLCAVAFLGETLTRWHLIAFPLIWLALAIYSLEAIRQDRALRRSSISSGTSVTTFM